jgi:hypothetical protein
MCMNRPHDTLLLPISCRPIELVQIREAIINRSFVDEGDLGRAQPVGAVGCSAGPDRLDPFTDKAGILAGAEVLAGTFPAREGVFIEQAAPMDEPGEQAAARL